MLCRVLALCALPLAGLAAQGSGLHLAITASNDASFRLVRLPDDGRTSPLVARGRVLIAADSAPSASLAIIADDSVNTVHVEAVENGHVVATGDGAYVAVRRDSGAVFLDVHSRVPDALRRSAGRKPDIERAARPR